MTRLTRWGAVIVWMAVIFFMSAQPQLPSPEERWLDFLFEKSAHTFEYAVLAALTVRAWGALGAIDKYAFIAGVLVAGVYALSDEFHQSFVPRRAAEWSDILVDWLGGIFGAWLWPHAWKAYHSRRRPEDV